jgi:hypothetical protein
MEFINPVVFAASMLTSSTVAENDYAVWAAGTAYTVGQRCIMTSTHRIYECLVNNTGAQPDQNTGGTTPKWLDVGATNKFAMFDDKWGTQTTASNTLTVQLTPGVVIDSLALSNLKGASVTITSTVAGVQKYTKTVKLQTDVGVVDWKTYFLAPIVAQSDAVVTDLLPYALQVITITITGPGTVAIGNLAMGSLVSLGKLLYSPTVGIIDYSSKSTDTWGNVTVTKRAYSKRFGGKFVIDNEFVDQVASLLASIRATPVVWMGNGDQYTSLVVWGFFKDFEIDIAYETMSYCSITIEGLI